MSNRKMMSVFVLFILSICVYSESSKSCQIDVSNIRDKIFLSTPRNTNCFFKKLNNNEYIIEVPGICSISTVTSHHFLFNKVYQDTLQISCDTKMDLDIMVHPKEFDQNCVLKDTNGLSLIGSGNVPVLHNNCNFKRTADGFFEFSRHCALSNSNSFAIFDNAGRQYSILNVFCEKGNKIFPAANLVSKACAAPNLVNAKTTNHCESVFDKGLCWYKCNDRMATKEGLSKGHVTCKYVEEKRKYMFDDVICDSKVFKIYFYIFFIKKNRFLVWTLHIFKPYRGNLL